MSCVLSVLVSLSSQMINHKNLPEKISYCNDRRYITKTNFAVNVRGKSFSCHRPTDAELLTRFNCSGTYLEKRSSFSSRKALTNAENAIKLIASDAAIKNGSTLQAIRRATAQLNRHIQRGRRFTRSLLPPPGQTQVCGCVLRCTTDIETNNVRACGECVTIYQQHESPRRAPRYINEVVCNPNESPDVILNGHPVGRCVQKTIDQSFWEATGLWVLDPSSGMYTQEFVPYSHTVKIGCEFQFYPGTPC